MLLVDEMHDMNAASFRVLRVLDSTQCQFCGVGDRDQSSTAPTGPMPCSWATPHRAHRPPGGAQPSRPATALAASSPPRPGVWQTNPTARWPHDTAVQLLGYDDEAECVT